MVLRGTLVCLAGSIPLFGNWDWSYTPEEALNFGLVRERRQIIISQPQPRQSASRGSGIPVADPDLLKIQDRRVNGSDDRIASSKNNNGACD